MSDAPSANSPAGAGCSPARMPRRAMRSMAIWAAAVGSTRRSRIYRGLTQIRQSATHAALRTAVRKGTIDAFQENDRRDAAIIPD